MIFFFKDFVCVLQMIVLGKKKIDVVLGLDSQDGKSTKDTANSTGNPRVNRGSSPLTANLTSADCDENSLEPQYNIQ